MFEIEQHTADIRLRIVAATVEELFADAVRGLMAVMKASPRGDAQQDSIEIDAPDLTALLVDFLNEVLLRCHTEQRAFEPESIVLRDHAITAGLTARAIDEFEEDVKAVTYHEAEVVETPDGWSTRLVLDV